METDPAVVRRVTATSRPSWEDNYPPGSVIKLLGGLQHLWEGADHPGRATAFVGML